MADESGTDVVYSAMTERQQYRREYYQANRAEILAYEKNRREAIKADPARLAEAKAKQADWYARRKALTPKKPRKVQTLKVPSDRYANPEYAAECRARSRKRYADPAKREDQLSKGAASRRANPGKWLLASAKARANKKGLVFDLVEVVVPATCPICDIPLCPGEGRWAGNSPTLDRVDPETGYIKTNVKVICFNCNAVKSNGSAELHEKIAAYMRGHNG